MLFNKRAVEIDPFQDDDFVFVICEADFGAFGGFGGKGGCWFADFFGK